MGSMSALPQRPPVTEREHTEENPSPPPKPRLRGWLHLGMTPAITIAGLFLVANGESAGMRLACVVYVISAIMLFGTSACYHRGSWGSGLLGVLRRLDHANIFVFIAGTYTPLAVGLLAGRSRVILLVTVWTVALLGMLFQMVWIGAPRWLLTSSYILMGWIAVGWLPQFWTAGGPGIVALIAAGGLCYSVGAVIYARKRPDPSPAWFGYHEIFHACTIAAALCHLVAIMIVAV